MMFNGLLICGDSDASDFTKESPAASSLEGRSPGSVPSEQYCRAQLLAALQVLRNKEETVRVQTQSLCVAEERIAALGARVDSLRAELDDTNRQLRILRNSAETTSKEKTDNSTATHIEQDVCNQSDIVQSLQNNLSVIEELYRECFYETAKQDHLIEMLRKSYLDIRLVEKQKSDRIERLEGVVSTQKWSLDKCQDIASEVENLKSDISNFLNNSNDSGVWGGAGSGCEDGLAAELGGELRAVTAQLLQLRQLLQYECTCGLNGENLALKETNEKLKAEIGELRQRLGEMETNDSARNSLQQRFEQQLDAKEREIKNVTRQLQTLENGSIEQNNEYESLRLQMQQTKELLSEKTAELEQALEISRKREEAINELRDQLSKADQTIKENCKVRDEVSHLTRQVSQWRAQLEQSRARALALERQLERARADCCSLHACCRERQARECQLEEQLREATARGAELCAESRRVVAAVRRWVRRMRAQHREAQIKISEQEIIISSLLGHKSETGINQAVGSRSSSSENEACCSKCVEERRPSRSRTNSSETATCPRCVAMECGKRVEAHDPMCANEMPSCSSVPVPPRRLLRKKATVPCVDKRCPWSRGMHGVLGVRAAGVQHPVRRDAATAPRTPAPAPAACTHHTSPHRLESHESSQIERVVERVECLSDAWLAAPRRWARKRPAHAPTPAHAPPSAS